jgi:hypothetical protein
VQIREASPSLRRFEASIDCWHSQACQKAYNAYNHKEFHKGKGDIGFLITIKFVHKADSNLFYR